MTAYRVPFVYASGYVKVQANSPEEAKRRAEAALTLIPANGSPVVIESATLGLVLDTPEPETPRARKLADGGTT